MRVLVAACVVSLVAVVPSAVGAQQLTFHSPNEADELRFLEDEAHVATGMYVAALGLGVVAVLGMAIGIPFTICDGGRPGPGGHPCESWGLPLTITGYTAVAAGVVALAIAIGLDVDSGSRRDGWRQRTGQLALASGPGEVGLGLRAWW